MDPRFDSLLLLNHLTHSAHIDHDKYTSWRVAHLKIANMKISLPFVGYEEPNLTSHWEMSFLKPPVYQQGTHSLGWTSRKPSPFPFVPYVSVCALSNAHGHAVFSMISPFAWHNLMSAWPSESLLRHHLSTPTRNLQAKTSQLTRCWSTFLTTMLSSPLENSKEHSIVTNYMWSNQAEWVESQ